MKELVYKGPKKGYAAIFVRDGSRHDSIRIFFSSKVNTVDGIPHNRIYRYWSSADEEENFIPCWDFPNLYDSDYTAYYKMMNYDLRMGGETIFLGYVKDTE